MKLSNWIGSIRKIWNAILYADFLPIPGSEVNDEVSFNELKELLGITDGNLASHLKTLEESEFVKFQKGFIGRKTNTTYSITKNGEKEFKLHLDALTKMIGSVK